MTDVYSHAPAEIRLILFDRLYPNTGYRSRRQTKIEKKKEKERKEKENAAGRDLLSLLL